MTNRMLKWFEYAHLPENLQVVSAPVGQLAAEMDAALYESPEKRAGLRKLLEAKDCFVRAAIENDSGPDDRWEGAG